MLPVCEYKKSGQGWVTSSCTWTWSFNLQPCGPLDGTNAQQSAMLLLLSYPLHRVHVLELLVNLQQHTLMTCHINYCHKSGFCLGLSTIPAAVSVVTLGFSSVISYFNLQFLHFLSCFVSLPVFVCLFWLIQFYLFLVCFFLFSVFNFDCLTLWVVSLPRFIFNFWLKKN